MQTNCSKTKRLPASQANQLPRPSCENHRGCNRAVRRNAEEVVAVESRPRSTNHQIPEQIADGGNKMRFAFRTLTKLNAGAPFALASCLVPLAASGCSGALDGDAGPSSAVPAVDVPGVPGAQAPIDPVTGAPVAVDPGAVDPITGQPVVPTGTTSCGATPQPGASPIRRMTRVEYNNTVRDLLGDDSSPAEAFALDEEALGFNNNAASLSTSSVLAEKYMIAAESVAQRATASMDSLVSCDPGAIGEEACALEFIADFGKRAFRRPLSETETGIFQEQFANGLQAGGFVDGIQRVIELALQSPAFLYRVEFGEAGAAAGGAVRLTNYETASRLSYMLWESMPDDALFAAADRGELSTAAQVEAQARRMLEDSRARDTVANFHMQWLDYDRMASVTKNSDVYPSWSRDIGELMTEEIRAFLDAAVFSADGGLNALLTSPTTFVNDTLADFYGIAEPGSDQMQSVALDPAQRAGVLSLGALMAINAHEDQASPVHRGQMVREQFLCTPLPPPPPGLVIEAPEPDPNATTRERFAQHSEDAACVGCHTLIDPIGFGFENFDGLGRFREEENGQPVDSLGELTATDVNGPFNGVVELANKLASSEQVKECYATQWFRFAYGRGETDADSCVLDNLTTGFTTTGGDIKELLVALTQTDAFLFRPAGGSQ